MDSRAKARYFSSYKKIPSQNSLLVTKKFDWVLCGGDDQTRTDYLYVANVSLYRVSYIPIDCYALNALIVYSNSKIFSIVFDPKKINFTNFFAIDGWRHYLFAPYRT